MRTIRILVDDGARRILRRQNGHEATAIANLRAVDAERQHLLTRMVSIQEDDRRRIASDVHDDPLQVMTAASLRLQLFRRDINGSEHAERLQQVEDGIRQAISGLRSLMFHLEPPLLNGESLMAALRLLLDHLTEETGIVCHVQDRTRTEPAWHVRALLYRSVQDALSDVRKRRTARNVFVTLTESARGVTVRVRDDGRHVSPGLGGGVRADPTALRPIRERVTLAGGWARAESTQDTGTTVEFWLPQAAATSTAPPQSRPAASA